MSCDKCTKCLIGTKVLIIGSTSNKIRENSIVKMHKNTAENIYNQMISDNENLINDIAIILQINGENIANNCQLSEVCTN